MTTGNPFAAVLAEVFGKELDDTSTNAPDSTSEPRPGTSPSRQPAASLGAAAAALTAELGVAAPEQRGGVEEHLGEALEELGLCARVESLRYGNLVVAADPITAAMLRTHSDQIVSLVNKHYPGAVRKVSLRARTVTPGAECGTGSVRPR